MNPETRIQNAIRDAAGRIPRVLLRRRMVGTFLAVPGPPGTLRAAATVLRKAGFAVQIVDVGDEGEADLQGMVAGWPCQWCGQAAHPMPVAVEVKTSTGKLSPDQRVWRDETWKRRGGLYVEARPPKGCDDEAAGAVRVVLQALGLEVQS